MSTSLRSYQSTGVEFLKARKRALLFDEPGLGKTAQALNAIGTRAIVICPKSVKAVWASECAKFRPDLKPVVVSGKKGFFIPSPGEIVVMNPAILPEICGTIPSDVDVVIDEVHQFKNIAAARTKRLHILAKMHTGRLWGMSGTPIMRDPGDFWGVLWSMCLTDATYGGFNEFLRQFRGVKIQYGWAWGRPLDTCMDCVRNFILGRSRADVAKDIPLKQYETYTVAVKTKDPPYDMDSVEKGRDGKLTVWRQTVGIEKAKAALEYIQEVNETEPVVVFCVHRAACDVFREAGFAIIDGETPDAERKKIIDLFQDRKIRGVCGTIGAMSVGVTLTAAHRLFMVERDWSPASNIQAEDRIARLGSTANQVIITDIIADSKLDQIIHGVLKRKQKLIDSTIEKERVSV